VPLALLCFIWHLLTPQIACARITCPLLAAGTIIDFTVKIFFGATWRLCLFAMNQQEQQVSYDPYRSMLNDFSCNEFLF
jgi:hypothetical protein